jgi:hypothetical protein
MARQVVSAGAGFSDDRAIMPILPGLSQLGTYRRGVLMLDDQQFQALSVKLATAVEEQARLREERRQLLDSGKVADAKQLTVALNDCSVVILELSLQLIIEAQLSDRQDLSESITSLLENIQSVFAEPDRPREMEHVWNIAFMVGVSTIAAAAVGAPLAALATNQAIGQKVLEDAILTFTTIALVEGADELRDHIKHHRHQGSPASPRHPEAVDVPSVVAGLIPTITLSDGTVLDAAARLDERNAALLDRHRPDTEGSSNDQSQRDKPDRSIQPPGF